MNRRGRTGRGLTFDSRRSRRHSRMVWMLVVGGLAVVTLGAGGWWLLRESGASPTAPRVALAAPRPVERAPAPASAKTAPAAAVAVPSAQPATVPVSQPALTEEANYELAAGDSSVPSADPDRQARALSAPIGDVAGTPPERSALDLMFVDEIILVQAGPNRPLAADSGTDRGRVESRSGNPQIESARSLLENGQILEARQQLNTLLARKPGGAEAAEIRALLRRIADESIFSRKLVPNDPLLESYTVEAGDVLIHVGRKFGVPHEVIMAINGIPDAEKIRVGQKLKVPRGPFHARIYRSDFRLDVYLGDVYLLSYRIGLGASGSTPDGIWRVKERLQNPTYYPSASATDKRIIPPDDPNNPLGEHWIGLEGIDGNAVGHEGYGIHGTMEPDSIGKAVSLGCIRMHNEDVAALYGMLLPGKSQVTIYP